MQYNSHANNLDIVSEIDDLCSSDSTSYPIGAKTRRVNSALEELVGGIINSDGVWQWDDTNQTNLPIGTIDLTDTIQAYSFTEELLQVEKLKVKDKDGKWQPLKQVDPSDFAYGVTIEEFFADTGLPTHYDIIGDTIKLYPAPATADVTLTAGLRVHFKRTASLFTTSDTTKEPGIISTHHILLAYMASIPYCQVNHKDRVTGYEKVVKRMTETLNAHYSRRSRDSERLESQSFS